VCSFIVYVILRGVPSRPASRVLRKKQWKECYQIQMDSIGYPGNLAQEERKEE
jgi:hypothetical protein